MWSAKYHQIWLASTQSTKPTRKKWKSWCSTLKRPTKLLRLPWRKISAKLVSITRFRQRDTIEEIRLLKNIAADVRLHQWYRSFHQRSGYVERGGEGSYGQDREIEENSRRKAIESKWDERVGLSPGWYGKQTASASKSCWKTSHSVQAKGKEWQARNVAERVGKRRKSIDWNKSVQELKKHTKPAFNC